VRQYLACGKPVICVPEGHDFIRENDLGAIAPITEQDTLEQATRIWAERVRKEKDRLALRLRQYAIDNLSADHALESRLKFWNKRQPRT
jgi:hypothetical protein